MDAGLSALEREKTPANVIASKEKEEEISFIATIPAKQGYALLLRANGKKAEAKIKITGR